MQRFKNYIAVSVTTKRNLFYAAMIGLVLGSYLLSLYYIQSFFKYSPDVFMVVNSIAVVIAALGFSPLEKKLQEVTNSIFYKQRNGYHETLKSLLNEMISCHSVKNLTKLIVRTIYNEMNVSSIAFYLFDKQDGYYLRTDQKNRGKLGNRKIAKNNKLVKHIKANHGILDFGLEKLPKAELVVPFYENKELLGFLVVDKKLSGDPFFKEDLNLLDSVSHQAVIGLQNARHYEEAQRKLNEQTTLFEVGKIISTTLNFSKVIKGVTKSVVDALEVDRGIMFLYDNKKKQLYSVAGYGAIKEKDSKGIILKIEGSVMGRIFKEGKPVYVPQVTRNTKYVQRLGASAYMAVPMKAKDNVIGLLAVDNFKTKKTLTNLNKDFLAALAGQLAVAVENARLYDDAKKKVKELSKLNRNILQLQGYNENMLSTMPSGVISFDNRGNIKTINDMAQKITGLTAKSKTAKDIKKALGNYPKIIEVFNKECLNSEIIFKDPVGNKKVLHISTRKLKDQNQRKVGMLSVITDMSDMKELETQVRRSDRVSALGTMVAGIAHEIKNPLTSMKLFIQLMEENQSNPNFWKEYGDIISGEVIRLEEIVENFLGFARTRDADMEDVAFKDIAERVYNLVKTQSSQEKVAVVLDVDPDIRIKADVQKMMQVFLNLILNAIQAMPADKKGKGKVVVAAQIDEQTDEAEINIIDNGCGMPKEHLEKLFTPFFTTKQKGNGLGLPIVHKIIEEHDGKIDVESEVGKGTVFRIVLPLVKQPVVA